MPDVTLTIIEGEDVHTFTCHSEHRSTLFVGLEVFAAFLRGHRGELRELVATAAGLARWLNQDGLASQEGPGNGPHLAAAGPEPVVGWSAKARAALELWEAHSETIRTLARSCGWASLTAEERGAGIAAQTAIQLSDRIADAVVAGVLDLIKTWAAEETAKNANPDYNRCENCEHLMQFHQPDGCWFGMQARVGRNSACPCGVGRGEPGDGCICNRREGEPGFGLLCPVHGDPISRKNLPREEGWDLTEQARQKLAELHGAAGRASAAIVEQTRQVLRDGLRLDSP